MERFLFECGALPIKGRLDQTISLMNDEVIGKGNSVTLANSETGIIFKIVRIGIMPETFGRYQVQLGSVTAGGTGFMNDLFCDELRFGGDRWLRVDMSVAGRNIGSLEADFLLDDVAKEVLYCRSVRFLDPGNPRRLAIEEILSRRSGVNTGKLDGFALECSWYGGMDAGWMVSVDFRSGRACIREGREGIILCKNLDDGTLKEIYSALKKERFMKGIVPAPICDGTLYELTLHYRSMDRRAIWNNGNGPFRFTELVEELYREDSTGAE